MDVNSTISGSAWVLLALAAFGAGGLNALAGGGSFLTFPALVFVGVPPIAANATSALAVSPGYLGSCWAMRAQLAGLPAGLLRREAALAALGGLVGALLLLVTPAQVFARLVPWLLLLATGLFMLGPRLARWLQPVEPSSRAAGGATLRGLGLALVAVYGGYFNGGLGILLMALYVVCGERDLRVANALKNLNSLVLSLLSVAAFVWAGAVQWSAGLWMMAAATLGGWAGAHLAQRLSAAWLRAGVIATGLVMSALFFARG